MTPIAVVGAGSFGTALAVHLARAGRATRLWVRRPELAEEIRRERENRTYLPGVLLPEAVEVVGEAAELDDAGPWIVAVPSHGYRGVLAEILAGTDPAVTRTVVSATKGIEIETLARMSRVSEQESERSGHRCGFAVLSGPTFAAELARGVPSAAVVASRDEALAASLRQLLASSSFRLYSSGDVVGVEIAGTAKNVIAIAAGVLAGLELGHNTLAALITRGLHEITRLALASGGEAETLRGLAGLGDLVLTCTGGLSRNRRTGLELARGRTLDEIQASTREVAEGVRNALAIRALAAEKGVEMPIVDQMCALLYEGKSPGLALRELMTRELKEESQL
ncbi:MAG TPA: NAD(P)H-dependent glycerol-3-phosphate dehydrogenase [Thermoanaerobaculia bacterium]|nr:NAD(P)H-dependent glycerol-3-phosphate dehydrogenase [Thermoanaerobaculia bacterium]